MVGRDVTIRYVGDSASAERAAARVRGANDKIKEGFAGVADSASRNFRKVGSSLTSAGRSITTFATLPIAGGFALALKAASDLNEQASKMKIVFGEQSAAIESFGANAAKNLGLSKKAAFEATGTFGNLFNQLGFGAEATSAFSQRLVTAAADLASFHNADITQVIEAQTAAFRGEYDSLQRFIPTINAAAVQEQALLYTGKATTKELTNQDKALATLQLMMEGMGKAQGDFARTSDSAANQQRILTARFQDLAATIGQQLLPIALQFGEFLAGLLDRFNKLSPTVQKFILIGLGLLAVLGPLVGAVGALATVLGLVIAPAGLVILALAAVVAGVIYAYQNFEGFRNVVDGVVHWFMESAVPGLQAGADFIVEKFGHLQAWWAETWPQISETVRHAVNVIRDVITVAVAVVTTLWEAFGETILAHVQRIWSLIYAVISSFLGTIRGIIKLFLAIINGEWGQAWQAIKDILAAKWALIVAVVKGGVTLVRDVLSLAWRGIRNTAGAAWNGIKSAIGAVWDGIKGVVTRGVNAVIGIINGLIGAVNWVLRKLKIPQIPTLGKLQDFSGNQKSAAGTSAPTRALAMGGMVPVGAGFMTNGPQAVVGEGNRAHPEFVIPTDPKYRGRAMGLFEQLGSHLIPGMALGGILGGIGDAVKGGFNFAKGLVGGLAGSVLRGALVAGVSGPNAIAKAALAKAANPFGVRDIVDGLRETIYQWVKGADSALPTAPPASAGGGGGSARGSVGWAARYMPFWKARYPWMSIGGWRAKGSVPGSDHPKGKALDLMTGSGAIHSDIIRTFLGQAGAKYWISMRRFASAAGGWRPHGYSGPSPHTDHVHLSYLKSGGIINAANLSRAQFRRLYAAGWRGDPRDNREALYSPRAQEKFKPLRLGQVHPSVWKHLLGQGWRGVPWDRMEALYPPGYHALLGRFFAAVTKQKQMRGYQHGGVVDRDGPGYLHRGETVIPRGRRGPQIVIENIVIHANTEAEGRSATRGFVNEIARRRVMTDARIS